MAINSMKYLLALLSIYIINAQVNILSPMDLVEVFKQKNGGSKTFN
jgi:hypothetical protein